MFGTSGIRGRVGERMTASLALDVGRAVGSTAVTRAVIGRDPRESGRFLLDAVAAGLQECGVDVVDLGVAATPTIARSVAWRDADAGVAVTASHNPPADNGLKLWSPTGQAFDEDRRERISSTVESGSYDLAAWDGVGERTAWTGAPDAHVDALVESVSVGCSPSVAVDVGNGAGGVTADALYALGCEVETLNAQPDGRFPGRPSEPTPEALESLCRHVEATGADVGVAHDGDADRMVAVDETGAVVPGDRLLALFGRATVESGERVAAPVNTSLAVDDALAEVGAEVIRTRVGDVHVAERAAGDGVAFGGEPSGAWIWPGETLCPDGPLAACKLIELLDGGESLSARLSALDAYPIRRASVDAVDKRRLMERVRQEVLAEYDDVSAVDGVRVDAGDGWFLVRASGTQPLVRLTAEARDPDRADQLLSTARELVERYRE